MKKNASRKIRFFFNFRSHERSELLEHQCFYILSTYSQVFFQNVPHGCVYHWFFFFLFAKKYKKYNIFYSKPKLTIVFFFNWYLAFWHYRIRTWTRNYSNVLRLRWWIKNRVQLQIISSFRQPKILTSDLNSTARKLLENEMEKLQL